jgi:hypothetical protein
LSTPSGKQPLRRLDCRDNGTDGIVVTDIAKAVLRHLCFSSEHVRELRVKPLQCARLLTSTVPQHLSHIPRRTRHVGHRSGAHSHAIAAPRTQLPLRRRSHRHQRAFGWCQPCTEADACPRIAEHHMLPCTVHHHRCDAHRGTFGGTLHGEHCQQHWLHGTQRRIELCFARGASYDA